MREKITKEEETRRGNRGREGRGEGIIKLICRSGTLTLPIVVHNPLSSSIIVTIGSEAVTIAAGQTAFANPTVFNGKLFK
jgi:hypothetical protein